MAKPNSRRARTLGWTGLSLVLILAIVATGIYLHRRASRPNPSVSSPQTPVADAATRPAKSPVPDLCTQPSDANAAPPSGKPTLWLDGKVFMTDLTTWHRATLEQMGLTLRRAEPHEGAEGMMIPDDEAGIDEYYVSKDGDELFDIELNRGSVYRVTASSPRICVTPGETLQGAVGVGSPVLAVIHSFGDYKTFYPERPGMSLSFPKYRGFAFFTMCEDAHTWDPKKPDAPPKKHPWELGENCQVDAIGIAGSADMNW